MGEQELKPKKAKAKPAEAPAPVYLAIVGITKGDVRIEAGEIVPPEIIAAAPWLVENNHVRPKKEAMIG